MKQSPNPGPKIDFFLSPEILKLGKSDPRVKMFFGDRIQNIDKAKKAQKIYKKEREWLVRTHFEKIYPTKKDQQLRKKERDELVRTHYETINKVEESNFVEK